MPAKATIPRVCEQCGNGFIVAPREIAKGNGRFCSKSCASRSRGRLNLRDDPQNMRAYKREWVAKRRADWLAEHGPCVQCGSADFLEVDHIDRTTKIDHNIWSWSQVRRDAELAKCQVLCRDCHLAKTIAEKPQAKHGSSRRYEDYGCRCVVCKAWRAAKTKRYRERKRNSRI